MWAAFRRVIKPRGAIVLTASQPFTSRLVCSNLGMFRYEWIWDKEMVVGIGAVDHRPLKSHESVLIFGLDTPNYYPVFRADVSTPFGKKSISLSLVNGSFGTDYRIGVGYPKSVLRFPRPNNLTGGGLHPTQKPVALFAYLIRTYTRPGDLVLDPVVGSGTTAIAARNEGRRFICGDKEARYVDIARKRLAEPYTLPLPLPVAAPERAEQLPLMEVRT